MKMIIMKFFDVYKILLETFGEQRWWPTQSKNQQFEIVLGAILTQQSSWKNVEEAIRKLKQKNFLTPKRLANADQAQVEKLVRRTSFFKQKARRVIDFAKYLQENYSGDIGLMFAKDKEKLRGELLSLKGIGKETADSIILYAAHKPIFVVDAYTYRVFSRLGLISGEEKYDELRELIERGIKTDEKVYGEFHALIVEHAKTICKKKPLCSDCPLLKECKFGKVYAKSQPM